VRHEQNQLKVALGEDSANSSDGASKEGVGEQSGLGFLDDERH
jgi:hypothetical protein